MLDMVLRHIFNSIIRTVEAESKSDLSSKQPGLHSNFKNLFNNYSIKPEVSILQNANGMPGIG